MSDLRRLAHLPCFRLDSFEPVSFGNGRLFHPTWEEWQDFDSDYPWQQRRYEQTRPLFYESAGGEGDLLHFKTNEAADIYFALTIREAAVSRTPAPILSVAYEVQDPSSEHSIGALDKSPLIWGIEEAYASIDLEEDDIRRARSALRVVVAARRDPELFRLLSVLELTARSEVDAATSLVLCMAALEDLLVGEPVDGLRKTFAARVASMGANDATSWQGLHDHAHLLYGLRSDIVHGDTSPTRLKKVGLPSLDALDPSLGRNLVRGTLVRAVAAVNGGLDLEALPATLDKAADDPAHLATLNDSIMAGVP